MTIEKNLSKALGIEHVSSNTKEVISYEPTEVKVIDEPKAVVATNQDEDEDYALVRNTMRNLITTGNQALLEIADIAKQNESARGFEVVANLIKTIGDTSKDLYALQKTKKELREPEKTTKVDETVISVDKAVFVGTTAELLKTIKSRQEGSNNE